MSSSRGPAAQLRALASKYREAKRTQGVDVPDSEPDYISALKYVELLAQEQDKLEAAKRSTTVEKAKNRLAKKTRSADGNDDVS